jgi:hypothetical protein
MALQSLSPEEAAGKLAAAEQEMNEVNRIVNQIRSTTNEMTSSSWLGDKAFTWNNRAEANMESLERVTARLADYIEIGKQNQNRVVEEDSGAPAPGSQAPASTSQLA